MIFNYNSPEMQNWRKEVLDFLGFDLRIPEYAQVKFRIEDFLAPVSDYLYHFYDEQGFLICTLKHNENFFFCEDQQTPGIPDTWGSDEDWMNKFVPNNYAPIFKGFPWSFTLTFFNHQQHMVKKIVARRTFRNDSRPTIHMAWYLSQWNYDDSGESSETYTTLFCDWELPRDSH